mgnify:CR=1 FL=1
MSHTQNCLYQLSDNVLNILVPETLFSIYDELNERFLDYFEFYRFRIYENDAAWMEIISIHNNYGIKYLVAVILFDIR